LEFSEVIEDEQLDCCI